MPESVYTGDRQSGSSNRALDLIAHHPLGERRPVRLAHHPRPSQVAMVTKRLAPLTVDGRPTWQIGFPIHWGFTGSSGHAGPLANLLTPSAMDPNTWTPEYKAFLVRLEKA